MEKQRILIVCGYGCHIEGTPLGQVYIPKIIRFIREWHPHFIIPCGGFTQKKSAPGISEARILFDYLDVALRGSQRFVIEDGSYTAHENIRNAAKHIKRLKLNNVRVVIYCEAQRAPNVMMIARWYFREFIESIDDLTVETASWERADPFKQVVNLIYNRLAFIFPYLIVRERNKRLKRSYHI